MRIALALIVAASLMHGCKHDSGKTDASGETMAQEAITITAIGYEETNDSIPPQYRESVIRYLDGAKVPDFADRISKALKETRVNDAITLHELILLNHRGDTEAISKLEAKKEARPEPAGAATIKLVFYSGQEIVYGLRIGRYDLTGEHVQALTELARKEGEDMNVDLGDFDTLNQPAPPESEEPAESTEEESEGAPEN